jgi:hypothetical protein
MIVDVPTAAELTEAGLNLLNLAWTVGVELLRALRSDDALTESDGLTDAYWARSQPALTNGLAVIDQSLETLVKARIAAVSPFLLLSRRPVSPAKDISFATLQTVGANDLFSLHNTVAPQRLGESFNKFLEDIRQKRNIIMHQPSASGPVHVADLFRLVTQAYRFLFPADRWLDVRLRHLGAHPLTIPWTGNIHAALIDELTVVVAMLTAADLQVCFGYDAASPAYRCPNCDGKLAQLRPNDPASTTLACFVCGATTPVVRHRCGTCGHDVESELGMDGVAGAGECLFCGALNDAVMEAAYTRAAAPTRRPRNPSAPSQPQDHPPAPGSAPLGRS